MSTRAGRVIDAEGTITAIAARQHGVVTRAQLIAAGLGADVVDRRLKAKRLRRVHRGVYLLGPVVSPLAPVMAATLACGDSAVVSHCSAAALCQLLSNESGTTPVDIAIGRERRCCRPHVRIHRISLHRDEVTKLAGIPITTPARTLYDLATTVSQRDLERALAEALAQGEANRSRIQTLLTRYDGRPGIARLRALLGGGVRPALTRSAAEESFLALIRRAKLPPPEVNVVVRGYEVDFFWRTERLVVEIDGFAFHSSARKFESDRRRDAALMAAGVRVSRVTWGQITEEPEAMLVRLGQALVRTG